MLVTLNMPNLLPKEFEFSHDFCIYLYDSIAQFIIEGESCGFFHTSFKFKSEKEKKEWERNPDIFDWLEEKGYSMVLGEVLLKTVFPGLLSDFCQFVFEALNCSRKGKLTVTYALLRKPLRENLFYMEWMLADPEDFLNTFYNQHSKELSFGKIGNPDKVKSIIKASLSNTPSKQALNANFIYDLRFNKQAPFGFEPLWNKAIHLITTKSPLETEQCNFNFIFSGPDEHQSQWEYLYNTLPYLLFYALEISEVIMALIANGKTTNFTERYFHRSLGFILWGHKKRDLTDCGCTDETGLECLALDCPKCGRTIEPSEKLMSTLFLKLKLRCPNCRSKIQLPLFIEKYNG